jgi:hypothetical protein
MAQLTVEAGIRGTVASYSPEPCVSPHDALYPATRTGSVWWRQCDVVMVDYLTSDDAAAAVLPAPCRLIRTSSPGTALVNLLFLSYHAAESRDPYLEMAVNIPCLFQGDVWSYVAFIEVTDERERSGYDQEGGTISLEDGGDEVYCALERHEGAPLASIGFRRQAAPISVPWPADERRVLPYAFNQTIALPPPAAAARPLLLRLLSLWPERQLMGTCWALEQGQAWVGEVSVSINREDNDALPDLPPYRTLGGLFYKGHMSAGPAPVSGEL